MPPPPPATQVPAAAAAPVTASPATAAAAPAQVPASQAPGGQSGWPARLDLRFETTADGATRLAHNRHSGPLRLLKALASGDGRRLEAVIVHPPGGLVGGDSLSIALDLRADARVLATTPGQQKWYRSDSPATACTRITLAAGACLEWLPQPAILFDRTQASQTLVVDMDAAACCTGWAVLVRGRAAMGEHFASGQVDQTLAISVARRLMWQERLHVAADDRIFASPLGWAGRRMAASVWCCAPALAADRLRELRDRWRAQLDGWVADGADRPGGVRGGATIAADGLLLAKILADDSEQLMALCQALWRTARLALEGNEGSVPRIWRT